MEVLEINGWKICFHSCFLEQISELVVIVSELKATKPTEYQRKKETNLLRAIEHIIEQRIVVDPFHPQFRQANTLGDAYKHWFRAKFLEQFRLFYRCSDEYKIIIIGWVNGFDTLRTYGSKNDAYTVFTKMLKTGCPPDDWETLLSQAKAATTNASCNGFLSI